MGNDRELLTLLQISDLHFGDKLGGHGVDQLSAGLPWLISGFRISMVYWRQSL